MKKVLILTLFVLGLMTGFAANITVSSNITSNTTWTNNNIYTLTGGFIYVTNNATLTIQAGTIVKGNGAALVITRGAKLIAIGTENQPIIFTSSQPAGSRAPGDWGGVLLLGKAPINDPNGQRLAEGGIDPTLGLYGGTDPNDNSGTMRYCRIEYAGIAYQPNNETNGLTMGGVGSGTTLEYIQVSRGGDDSFEWFGGTVSGKYLVAYAGVDDDFDVDYGYNGKVQFGVSLRDSLIADVSGSTGFESDNDATGTTNQPFTNGTFSNMTVFGPRRALNTQINSLFTRAAHLRRSTQIDIYNSVLVGFPTGLKIEGANTAAAVTAGNLQFRNNILAGMTNNLDSSGLNFGMANWFASNGNSTLTNPGDVMATNPYNYNNPNFVPQSGSPTLSGANFTHSNLQNAFFTPTTYRGAFGTENWCACWTEFDPNAQAYNTVPVNYAPTGTLTISASGSTTFCQGGSVTLTASAGFTSYLWSNGATTQSITVTQGGTYWVKGFNTRGCSKTSSNTVVTVKTAPTVSASAQGPTTFCTGNSVLLQGNPTGGVSFQWFRDGVSLSGATSAYYNATTSGSYQLRATAKNACQAFSSSLIVTANAVPTATISGTNSFCVGQTSTLSAPTGAGLGYQWYQGGSVIPGATSSTFVAATGGTYNVRVSNANCSALSGNFIVTANAVPVASITPSTNVSICPGSSATLTATNVTGATYVWFRNGQVVAGANTNSITTSLTGSYAANVSKSGCTSSTNTVPVSSQPSPVINTIPSNISTVCQGVGVLLTSASGSTFQWYRNGVALTGATTANYVANTTGTYTLLSNGCLSSPYTLTVNPLPTATITNGSGSTSFCIPNSVVLNANTGAGLSYQWRKANQNIAGATAASFTATTSGSYTVEVTNANGCTKTSTAISLTGSTPPSTPTVTRSGNVLTSSVGTTYQWQNNGNNISGATNQTYTVPGAGCYRVRITNTNGCQAFSDTTCFNSTASRGNETSEFEVSGIVMTVVPNPNNGAFDLNMTSDVEFDTQVEVYNTLGQLVHSQAVTLTLGQSTKRIELNNALAGIYFVRINTPTGRVESKMIVQ